MAAIQGALRTWGDVLPVFTDPVRNDKGRCVPQLPYHRRQPGSGRHDIAASDPGLRFSTSLFAPSSVQLTGTSGHVSRDHGLNGIAAQVDDDGDQRRILIGPILQRVLTGMPERKDAVAGVLGL